MAETKIGKQRLVTGEEFDLVYRGEPREQEQGNLYAVADKWKVPFHGHARRLRVDLREFNKFDAYIDHSIRAAGECVIFVDDFSVYSFKFQHSEDGLIHAWNIIDRLKQFSLSVFGTEFFGSEEINSVLLNRKAYLNNIPAVVDQFFGSGSVQLRCSTEQGLFPFTAKELEYHLDKDGKAFKVVDILSSDIHWFRDD